jgi:aspartate-semialdehyde dehydrogenase
MIPSLNGSFYCEKVKQNQKEGITLISSPNCVSGPLCFALQSLHRDFGLKKIIISTYQSVSGYGAKGPKILFHEAKQEFSPKGYTDKSDGGHGSFEKKIAHNILPCIGSLQDKEGLSSEEIKIAQEIKKILNIADEKIAIEVFASRVPVFKGHSASVFAETEKKIPLRQGLRRFFDQETKVFVVDRLDFEVTEELKQTNAKTNAKTHNEPSLPSLKEILKSKYTAAVKDYQNSMNATQVVSFNREVQPAHGKSQPASQHQEHPNDPDSNPFSQWITPSDIEGDCNVWLSRIRRYDDYNLGFWSTWDNLTIGSSYNALMIFEWLYSKDFLKN